MSKKRADGVKCIQNVYMDKSKMKKIPKKSYKHEICGTFLVWLFFQLLDIHCLQYSSQLGCII